MTEKDIQKSIIDYLRLHGWIVVKFPSVGIYKQKTGTYIPQPQRGVADLLCCDSKGRYVAIEVKQPGNKPTPEQHEFLESIRKKGGKAFVAYSIDDVIPYL